MTPNKARNTRPPTTPPTIGPMWFVDFPDPSMAGAEVDGAADVRTEVVDASVEKVEDGFDVVDDDEDEEETVLSSTSPTMSLNPRLGLSFWVDV